MNFGIWELLIILIIVALLFGTAKLRNIGGDLGSALKSFRSALKDESDTSDSNKPQGPGHASNPETAHNTGATHDDQRQG